MTDYLVYDVFTDAPFGGNPLAVIPDATALPEVRLQAIAREFNFSETTFVFPPDDPSCDAKVRIFTPTMEVPFAGHPTIGTATALHALARVGDDMVLQLGVGPIPVAIRDGVARFTKQAVAVQIPGVQQRLRMFVGRACRRQRDRAALGHGISAARRGHRIAADSLHVQTDRAADEQIEHVSIPILGADGRPVALQDDRIVVVAADASP